MDYNEYLSDDEVISEENENTIYDINGMPIYQEDEEEYIEMRRIVSNKQLNLNIDDELFVSNIEKKPKEIKEIKEIKKKSLSINDLNILLDEKIEKSKPIKFISKRSLEKRDNSNLNTVVEKIIYKKRCFNPRLPPYFMSDNYKNKNKNNIPVDIDDCDENFPSLI
jgi:hypothetical protein